MIAAVALGATASLATTNPDDFRRLGAGWIADHYGVI
jgi:predicted nucleic acid-binding protein